MSILSKMVNKARTLRVKEKDTQAARRWARFANFFRAEGAPEEIALTFEDEGRWEKAFKWHCKGVEQEDRNALVSLAHCYLEGKGTRKSLPDYINCLKDAAEQDSIPAMIELGDCYANGTGVRRDEKKAAEWYEKAAKKGSKKAKNALENQADEKAKRDAAKEPEVPEKAVPSAAALRWYKKAVLDENPDAQFKMGIWTLLGMGLDQDIPAGKSLLSDAAQGGVKEAKSLIKDMSSETAQGAEASTQYVVGMLFANGKYCEPDEAKAADCFKKAAKAGHIKAMYELGQCYENGRGVKLDLTQAENWNTKAAELANKDALKAKDRIADKIKEAKKAAKAKKK